MLKIKVNIQLAAPKIHCKDTHNKLSDKKVGQTDTWKRKMHGKVNSSPILYALGKP